MSDPPRARSRVRARPNRPASKPRCLCRCARWLAGAIKNRGRRADPSDPNLPRPAEPVARKVQARKAGASPLDSEPRARAINRTPRADPDDRGWIGAKSRRSRSPPAPRIIAPTPPNTALTTPPPLPRSFSPAVVSKATVAKVQVPKKVALTSAVTSLATQALPALAVVDERLNGDGTGLIFGINDESLGFILLTVPFLVFSAFYVAQKDAGIAAGGENDDSGLSL